MHEVNATEGRQSRAAAVSLDDPSERRALVRRIAITAAMGIYFWTGAQGIALISRHMRAHTLNTPLDAAIPFIPWSVIVYSWAYTLVLFPLFVVRCDRLFRRAALAFFVALTASFLIFLVFPVTSAALRADPRTLDLSTFHGWAMRLTYAVDPPFNLFPSMHFSLALLTACVVWKASPRLSWFVWPIALAIGVTICTTKQHFVADGVGAALLAFIVYRVVIAPYDQERIPLSSRSYGGRGAAAYFAFHTLFYACFFAAYTAGISL